MKFTRLKRLFGLVLLCALMFGAGGCSKKARSVVYLTQADSYAKAAQFDKAEIEYRNAMRLDPVSTRGITGLGIVFLQQGRIGMALPYLVKARELDPDNPALRLAMARLHLMTGNLSAAFKEADFLLDKNPQDGWAPILLSQSIVGEAEAAKLKERLQKLATIKSTAALQAAIGMIELGLHNDAAAEAAFSGALLLDAQSYHAKLGLGALAQKQKKTEQAEQYVKEAAAAAPRWSQESLTYAKYKMNAKEYDAAKKLLGQMLKETPEYLPILVMQAEIAAAEKSYDRCAALIEKILAKDPFQPGILLLSGRLNLATGDPKKAIVVFERMAKMYPRAAYVQQQLAAAYSADKEERKAVEALNRAIALDPGFVEPVIMLARIQIEKKEYDTTIVALQRLLENRPGLPVAQSLLADTYLLKGNTADAIKIYLELEPMDTKDPHAPWSLGLAYLQQRKLAEAREAFNRVLAIDPDNLFAVEQLVNLDLQEKLYDSARQRATQFRTSHPAIAEAALLEVKIHLVQRQVAEAEGILLGFLQAQPDSRPAQSMLVKLYLGTGRPAEAVPHLQQMIEKQPADVESLILLGSIQQTAGKLPEARAAYEKILALDASNPVALNNLAGLYVDLGDLDKGLAAARKARELLPHSPNVADTLGWALYKQRQYSAALILCKEAADKLGENAEIQYHLGMIYYSLGQENDASAALEKATRLENKAAWLSEAGRVLAALKLVAAADSPDLQAQLTKALAERPTDPVVLYRLALAEERRGNYAPAVDLLTRVLAVNAEHVDSLLGLARINAFNLGNIPKAFEYAKAAQKLEPDEPRVIQLTGRIAYLAGSYPWAVSLLRRAAAAPNVDAEVLYNLAEAELAVGQISAAVTAMQQVAEKGKFFLRQDEAKRFLDLIRVAQQPGQEKAAEPAVAQELQRDPHSLPGLMAGAALAAARGDTAAAAKYHETTLSVYPGFFPAKKALAAIYVWDNKKQDRAYELAIQARTDYPDDAELTGVLGVLLYRRDEYQKAVTALLQVIRPTGGDSRLVYYLGMAQYKLKDTFGARTSLERALKMGGLPDNLAFDARDTLDSKLSSVLNR